MRIHRIAERNCLENSWRGLNHVFWWRKSGNKGASGLVLTSCETPEGSPFRFSKQFQKGYSRKLGFRLEAFSETQRLRFVVLVFTNASFGLLLLSGRGVSLILELCHRG